MKKIGYVFLLLAFMIFPFVVNAETYKVSETDVSISFNDPAWYVFTRDNIKDNSELTGLGLTYEYMDNLMKTNNIYMDAALFNETDANENLEMFIRVIDLTEDVGNLHTYSESEIKTFGDELLNSGKFNMTGYSIYGDKYKYIVFEYTDLGYNIHQYYTVINGKGYNFTTQKINKINDSDRAIIKNIIDTIEFELDSYYETPIGSENGSSLKDSIIRGAIIGAIVGLIGGIVAKIKKGKDNNQNNNKNNVMGPNQQYTPQNPQSNPYLNNDINNNNNNNTMM